MPWPTPQFSKNQINRAGDILIQENAAPEELEGALDILENWRACHGYPINTFQATLRNKLRHIDQQGIVAQRLKRTPSIISKLKRFDKMRLARMQDIGGLRAIVYSIKRVRILESEYREGSRFKHELVSVRDYIQGPKNDGYRSIHLVFSYRSAIAPDYNGLSLELQLRSRLQHTWATAVETMGTFLGQALKSHQGEQRWLDFFAATSSAFAYLERAARVPGYEHLSPIQTFDLVAEAESRLRVLEKLRSFSTAMDFIGNRQRVSGYHLITLNSQEKSVTVRGYTRDDLEQAVEDYSKAEMRAKDGEPLESVLVSAGSIESLRRAFPNYFLDTHDFVRRVESIINPRSSVRAKMKTLRPGHRS